MSRICYDNQVKWIFLLSILLFGSSITIGQINPKETSNKAKISLKKSDANSEINENGVILDSEKSAAKKISIKKKSDDLIIIDWISPLKKKFSISGNKLELKFKVIASQSVSKEDIVIYHNDQVVGSKADEVGLFGNNAKTEFTYNNKISLVKGENKIQVGVKLNDKIQKSESKIFKKEGNELIDITGKNEASMDFVGNCVYWVEPDPLETGGTPIVKNERELRTLFMINSEIDIDKSNVNLIHNNVLRQPSFKSKLKKISSGKYLFEDFVQLDEQFDINVLKARVNSTEGTIESESLLIDFTPIRPNLMVIAIGTETNLAYTEKDARDFGDLYKGQGGKIGNRLFNTVNVHTLLGAEASAGEIKGRIEELKVKLETGNLSDKDVIIIFISSHGFILDNEFRIQGDDYDPSRKLSTSVSYQKEIADILEKLPCKKLVFIDACHSGGGGARANISDINYEIEKLNQKKKGLTSIVSSKGDEESYEDVVWQNGAFTEAIIQGLKHGQADLDNNLIITIDELFNFVKNHVSQIVSKVKRKPQHPAIIKNDLGDLPIYVIQ